MKLQVKLLPCVIFFCNGVAVDRIAGFDELGAKDDFSTVKLEKRLLQGGVITELQKKQDSDDEELEQMRNVRSTVKDLPDEDSDFD